MLRLPRRLRRLAVGACLGLVVAATSVTGTTTPAAAIPAGECRPVAVDKAGSRARAIFTGSVDTATGRPRTDGLTGQLFSQDVTVTRVYTGAVTSDIVDVETDRARGQCSLGRLAVGTTYVFFVTGSGTDVDPWQAAGGAGTAIAADTLVGEVEAIYGAGRAPVAPAQEPVAFEPTGLDDPPRVTRLAAPGAALVILGLLGLVLVGWRGRGRRDTRLAG